MYVHIQMDLPVKGPSEGELSRSAINDGAQTLRPQKEELNNNSSCNNNKETKEQLQQQ